MLTLLAVKFMISLCIVYQITDLLHCFPISIIVYIQKETRKIINYKYLTNIQTSPELDLVSEWDEQTCCKLI